MVLQILIVQNIPGEILMSRFTIEISQLNIGDGGDYTISIQDINNESTIFGRGNTPEKAWKELVEYLNSSDIYPWSFQEPECWHNGYSYCKIVNNYFKWIRVYRGMQQAGSSYEINIPMRNIIVSYLGECGKNIFKNSSTTNFFVRNFFHVGTDKPIEDLVEFYNLHKSIFERNV